ncbi:ABC transporter permease [Pseudodesulfovibrio sp.]|uniref:ABC transporter permease n=1 Tax=Pseudodesulfovibrio sp. TaxID=2035812 RepID=UPI00262654DA|nr:ABC transporter permease [Pseudodesulfovibrio sp.]MDD3313314.1 ABC transporter permease [Pseudodesulfovibrio sp.]
MGKDGAEQASVGAPAATAETRNGKGAKPVVTVITPHDGGANCSIRQMFKYRGLIRSMIWRNLRQQFDELALGFFWATARPLAMAFVFSFIKSRTGANMKVDLPYMLYFYSGIILWFAFVEASRGAAMSMVKEAGLLKKIYFPRTIPPLVATLLSLYNLSISAIPLVGFMIWYGVPPGLNLVFLPLVLCVFLLLAYGVGIMFAALGSLSKDFERLFSIILYVGLFVSPVIYSPEIISNRAQLIFNLNPMSGILLSFRACLFQGYPFPWEQFGYSAGFAVVMYFLGTSMFKKALTYFLDRM